MVLSREKCKAVIKDYKDRDAVIISSDTVVDLDGRILEKPADKTEAFRMIKSLSDNVHKVHTAVSVYKRGIIYTFADTTEVYVDSIPDDTIAAYVETDEPYDSHNLPKEPFSVGANLVIALVIGLVVGWIVTAVMKGQLKTVRQQVRADAYITADSLQLTHSRDIFLYTHIDRREKPKQSSGSSTHTSSSGASHGGGGGKF